MNSIYTYETVDKLVCILHQKNTAWKYCFYFSWFLNSTCKKQWNYEIIKKILSNKLYSYNKIRLISGKQNFNNKKR